MKMRSVKRLSKSRPTLEGAGVRLNRAIGFSGADSDFDPFLLLDDFRSDVPEDYIKGFPFHPHRGMETITYVLAGTVEHRDSLGHKSSWAEHLRQHKRVTRYDQDIHNCVRAYHSGDAPPVMRHYLALNRTRSRWPANPE